MRLGQILVALLAPLVGFAPILRADLSGAGKPESSNSLTGLMRTAVPMAAALAVQIGRHHSGRAPRISAAAFRATVLVQAKQPSSRATAASVHLLTRQHCLAPLRC